ncbi:hypothetical protein EAI_01233 [Harpegnathos saltator]|uniref:Tetratricopeptide repeat protein 29 n=1 Tax=Harpegnathos saltator TaxID=610380 RepID=E2BGM1_HARSA|nr:hypothetical protein EAI_01233 [Harpegnathos saltator]
MKQRYNTLLVLQICARRRSIFSLFSIDVPPTRFYLPLHEAIVHELEENGYDESIGYLRELLELDEEARKGAGPGTLAWKKPRLKDNKSALLHLKEGFFAFEQAKNAGDSVSMTMAFLHTATSFQTMACEWWWVAERLYRSAITNAERRPDVATPHLEKSFDLYNELGLYGEANKARIIAGVSRGQGSIDKYIDLVRRCGTAVGSKAISTLCQWKNRRNTFFTETKLCTEDSEDLDGEHIDETMSSAPSVTTITADVAKSNIDN